ncbi:HXXEE domain-containing protein [Paenibacillus sp.]|uniref:HXXEE domain-containing protein n=1 Tax=Paenibacillus sp. TaxID=58172 RepID=UPI0028367403|nr:HXXEE domain-containing protein [Paenibacillus sp.]MDR0268852.1 HXXEE domain-containing protein [Paenibacillus sp.]
MSNQNQLQVLIWLIPVAFFIHDGEEIITMEKWLRNHRNHSRMAFENRFLDPGKSITLQFTVAVLLLGSILILIAFESVRGFENNGNLNMLCAGVLAVILIDGIKHVIFSLLLRAYSSGVITAILVEIPFASYALYRFYDAGKISVASLAGGLAIALPLTILLILCGFKLGKWIIPYRNHRA